MSDPSLRGDHRRTVKSRRTLGRETEATLVGALVVNPSRGSPEQANQGRLLVLHTPARDVDDPLGDHQGISLTLAGHLFEPLLERLETNFDLGHFYYPLLIVLKTMSVDTKNVYPRKTRTPALESWCLSCSFGLVVFFTTQISALEGS